MNSQPVESILSRLSGVRRSGSGATAKCPAHDDSRASLSISEGSDGRALLKCHTGCDSETIVSKLGLGKADLFPPRENSPKIAAEYQYRDEAGTLRYVVQRRDPKDFRQWRPDGKGGKTWNLKDVEPLPYRLPELRAASQDEPVLIVEGEKDVDRLRSFGFVASTNSGGAGKWRPELSRYFTKRRVVIIPDNDEPGRNHARQVAAALRGIAESISTLELPNLPPKGDVSDWLAAGGTAEALQALIAKAPENVTQAAVAPVGIVDLEALRADIEQLYETGLQRGTSTGFASVDDHFTVRREELTLITGIPGHGKSGWLDNVMVNIARRDEWRFAVFSAENYPASRHAAAMLEKVTGKPFNIGPTNRMSPGEVRAGLVVLNTLFRFIDPPEDQRNVDGLLAIIEAIATRERIDGAVIDPWNELDHARPDGITETEHVSRSLTKIRRFARQHKLAFFIVAHPAKMQKGQDGNYPVPTPYDIAGSAHWRNKADNCITVWRDITNGDRPEVEIHIQKIRFREVGRIGMVPLLFDRVTGRYSDASAPRLAPWEGRA